MKKCISITLFIIIFCSFIHAEEHTVNSDLKANIWNDIMGGLTEQKLRLNYDDKSNSLALYIENILFPIEIDFKEGMRVKMLEYIQKYKEWNKLASQKNVKLQKPIGALPSTNIYFKYGDEWHQSKSSVITTEFFSQSEQRHQMLMEFEKLTAGSNEYISFTPGTLYFNWDEIVAFEKAISTESMGKYLKEIKNKKDVADDFK